MTIAIQALLEQHPHLKDPLEFYARWQRFQREVVELLPTDGSALSAGDSRAYPRQCAASVMQLFATVFELPAKELGQLSRSLEAGEIDFMRLPLGEVPDLSLPFAADELASLLFLLSRPYFLTLREAFPLDDRRWENGRCPLCSAQPALASITEGPQRLLHCSYCGTVAPYRFIGCPHCGTENSSKLGTLVPEEDSGVRVSTCDECRTYVKIVEAPVLKEMTPDLADLVSLPLDIVAQEKGYTRKAPNPIGLKKIG